MLSYSPSIASAFTPATTFFAVAFASLYYFLSLSALVRFQVFSLSFFSLTAFSVSSFHHQLSNPGFFFPGDLPQISSPHVLICLAVSSHHSSTFVVITSIPLDSMSSTHLMKFSFTLSSFSFHHLICFLPSALLCLVAFTSNSATSTRCWVVTASWGRTLQLVHSFAPCIMYSLFSSRVLLQNPILVCHPH